MKTKLLCRLFGHDWRYNFPSLPSKCICARCNTKEKLDLPSLKWNKVESFDASLGTDKELIKRWVKL